jgi:hypothetical protein
VLVCALLALCLDGASAGSHFQNLRVCLGRRLHRGPAPRRALGQPDDVLQADGGVKKKLLVEGSGWEQPEKDDKVFGTPHQGYR